MKFFKPPIHDSEVPPWREWVTRTLNSESADTDHNPLTVADSTSIDLSVTAGQELSAEAIFGTTSGTVAEGDHGHTSLTLSGALAANGGITVDTNKFIVADGTGNTTIAGTLAAGNTTVTGTGLTLNATGTGSAIQITGSAATDYSYLQAQNPSGVQVQLTANGTTDSRLNCASNHGLLLMTNNATRISISSAGVVQIGDGSNYTEIETDGTIEFVGDATVWEDLNFDTTSGGGPPASLPADVTINNVFHREFASTNNQTCGGCREIPHAYDLGTTMYPHAHIFLKASESSGTTGVTFTFYWELRQTTGTTSGSVDISATSAELAANANKINIGDATGFTGPTELGANLACRIARTAGNAGDVVVMTYGVHYAIDTIGSRGVTTK